MSEEKTIQKVTVELMDRLSKSSLVMDKMNVDLVITNANCKNWCMLQPDSFNVSWAILAGYKDKPLPKGDSTEEIHQMAEWIDKRRPIEDEKVLVDPMFTEMLSMALRYFIEIVDDVRVPWVRFRETTIVTTSGPKSALVLETTVGDFVCYAFLGRLNIEV